ncbi:glycosyltransferase family 4 protein [Synechococcus sp. AH-551-C10]|nr:glycosyltransferase family 4 protein [Synechococcus sp. AH-551-C10]MDB4659651.1 glycosyltransferase family 4 protein [Synechococcus sp. AH-551-C10]
MAISRNCIAFPSPPQLHGGPGSFQVRFEDALRRRGWIIIYSNQSQIHPIDVIVVIAGTRRLGWLLWHKFRGVPIIQRLDGLLWQDKFGNKGLWRGRVKPYILQLLVTFIYRFIADSVVYQSEFVRQCWNKHLCYRPRTYSVIHNAVDLEEFVPDPFNSYLHSDYKPKLLCVEGEVQSSDANIKPLMNVGSRLLAQNLISGVTVVGDISKDVRVRLENAIPNIDIKGRLTRDETRALYPGSVYLALEINAPCPNSIIEAMASGCPVVGFNSGALAELVPSYAGQIVPYDGDPWRVDVPDSYKLLQGLLAVLRDYSSFSVQARRVAVERYDLNKMVESYINCIIESFYG